MLTLDDALTTLKQIDVSLAEVVELKFFGGLTIVEMTDVLSTPKRTVERKPNVAKAWLLIEIKEF